MIHSDEFLKVSWFKICAHFEKMSNFAKIAGTSRPFFWSRKCGQPRVYDYAGHIIPMFLFWLLIKYFQFHDCNKKIFLDNPINVIGPGACVSSKCKISQWKTPWNPPDGTEIAFAAKIWFEYFPSRQRFSFPWWLLRGRYTLFTLHCKWNNDSSEAGIQQCKGNNVTGRSNYARACRFRASVIGNLSGFPLTPLYGSAPTAFYR